MMRRFGWLGLFALLASSLVSAVQAQTGTYVVQTLAGVTPVTDSVAGTDAILSAPGIVLLDGFGGIYFSDGGSGKIHRLRASGEISTLANFSAIGMALDRQRQILLASYTRVYRLEQDGSLTPIAGSTPESCCADRQENVPALQVQLSITSIAAGPDGSVYIAEGLANRIRRVNPAGIITTFAGSFGDGFSGDGGPATAALLNHPTSLAFDAGGNLYFLDFFNGRVRRIDTTGTIRTIMGNAVPGRPIPGSTSDSPLGSSVQQIAVAADGQLYWSEGDNPSIWRLDAGGRVQLVAGSQGVGFSGDGGSATLAKLGRPTGLAIGSDIWIADSGNSRVRAVDSRGIIRTVAGRAPNSDGSALNTTLVAPYSAVMDRQGNLYFSEPNENRIRRVAPDGKVAVVAGTGVAGFSGDGGAATSARLSAPLDLALDPAGRLSFADSNNYRVRRINTDGTISTIAGIGFDISITPADYADNIPAARAAVFPFSLAYDRQGNLYIGDFSSQLIRKVDLSGRIFTIAGTLAGQGLGGDGLPAIRTSISRPLYLAVDGSGRVYFTGADQRIRRIGTDGIISTVVGNGLPGIYRDGDSALGPAGSPAGLAVDDQGALTFADQLNASVIQVIAGRLNRIGGLGRPTLSSDKPLNGVAARESAFSGPRSVSLDSQGNLIVVDGGFRLIRRLTRVAPAEMRIVDGNGQAGAPGSELSTRLRVSVLDNSGNPLAGIPVRFSVVTGRATLTDASVLSDPTGLASTSVRLGNEAGNVSVEAAVTGVAPATFFLRSVAGLVGLAPAIRSVALPASFGARSIIAPGVWLEIYGNNLSTVAREWSAADFHANTAPSELAGVSILIGGRPAAAISYVSPSQVNVQVPDGPFGTLVFVQAIGPGGTSNEVLVNATTAAPALLAPASFRASRQYAVALFADGSYAGPAGLVSGLNTRPARPGERLVLFGIGFGHFPGVPSGTITTGPAVVPDISIRIGGRAATIEYGGLAQGSVGLYQFNVVVPEGLSAGDQLLELSAGTAKLQQELWLSLAPAQ